MEKEIQRKPSWTVLALSHTFRVPFRTFTWQVYLFSSSDIHHSGTPLRDVIYWEQLPPSTLPMSYVFRSTTCPSQQFLVAPWPTQKSIMHIIVIYKCGWYSKTHLKVQRVSQSDFNSTHLLTHLLTTFKGSSSSIISASSSRSSSTIQSASTIQTSDHGKTFCPECSWVSAWGVPCMFSSSFLYGMFPDT